MTPTETSRPDKLTHAQTILYEIDMLRFAAHSFGEQDELSSWRNLECSLLHFRNLIEVFGKPPSRDDLSIQRPETIWLDAATRPSADVLNRFHRKDLWDKYETRSGAQVKDKISRYLQHCTEQRVDGKTWKIREMFEELDPLMSQFEALLPDKSCPWERALSPDRMTVEAMHDSHTATVTKGGPLIDDLTK